MSNDGKVKIYRNPARKTGETLKPYVPQYQQMGVSPEEYKSPLTPGYNAGKPVVAKPSNVNPRAPRPMVQQPYAEAVTSPIGRGRGLIPNVGNNMEQTWSGMDGEDITDDMQLNPSQLDPDHPMVDNNDFVSAAALGLPEELQEDFEEEHEITPQRPHLTSNELKNALNSLENGSLSTTIDQLDDGEYLLIVGGSAICSGPADFIEEQTRSMVFGEHDLYHGNPVSVDDIVVLKRVKIKVGVFLE